MCEGGKDFSRFHEGHHPSLEGKVLRPKAWNVNGSFMDGPSKEHVGSAKNGSCVHRGLTPRGDRGLPGRPGRPKHCQQSIAVQPGACDAA